MEVIVVLEKSKQWICKFIVLFLCITGMCFENVEADPVFVCTMITEDAIAHQNVSDKDKVSVYMEKETDVTETIVARSATNTQQVIASLTNGKRTLKLSVAIIYVTALSLLLSNSYAMAYISWLPERVCKTIVVNYIHNMDGKKKA